MTVYTNRIGREIRVVAEMGNGLLWCETHDVVSGPKVVFMSEKTLILLGYKPKHECL